MAWSYLPCDEDSDWSLTLLQNEIRNAIKERKVAIASSYSTISNGHDIQAASYVRDMQSAIENLCSNFVATIDSAGNPVTDYDGKDEIEMWTWDKIKTRVLGHDWTRKYGDDDSPTTAYGYHRAGDFQDTKPASVLWNEMRLVLNELRWTRGNLTAVDSYYITGNWNQYSEGDYSPSPPDTWDAAKAVVESLWGSGYGHGGDTLIYTSGSRYPSYPYYAAAFSRYCFYKAMFLPVGYSKIVDFYILSQKYGSYIFDNNGIAYLIEDKYGKFPTSANLASDETETETITVGDDTLSVPNWCDEPTAENVTGRGFEVTGPLYYVAKWNFTYLG